MKTIVHVNQHVLRKNRLTGDHNPPLTVKTYKAQQNASRAKIIHDGVVVAEVVYQPDKPLSCGATVWIETQQDVEVI